MLHVLLKYDTASRKTIKQWFFNLSILSAHVWTVVNFYRFDAHNHIMLCHRQCLYHVCWNVCSTRKNMEQNWAWWGKDRYHGDTRETWSLLDNTKQQHIIIYTKYNHKYIYDILYKLIMLCKTIVISRMSHCPSWSSNFVPRPVSGCAKDHWRMTHLAASSLRVVAVVRNKFNEWRTKLPTTRNGHGQSGWPPIGCECFRTNFNIPCPFSTTWVFC